MSVLHICEYLALNYSCNVKKDCIHSVSCFGGKGRKMKTPYVPCEVPLQQIRMHNHNVVKDEIKSWNYFQLDFVTESDPLWVLCLSLAEILILPRGKGEFSMHPHHQLSTLCAMFNSSELHFMKHKYISLDWYGWTSAKMEIHRVINSIYHWLNFIQSATVPEKIW